MAKTKQIDKDINFIKSILPNHYLVQESKTKGSIHCKSDVGIRHKIDADDDEHWSYIVKAIEKHFKERFQEIDHNTCFCHTDFTIYLKEQLLMLKIHTKQKSNGNWWCNTTHDGYDIYTESITWEEAQSLMTRKLKNRKFDGQLEWKILEFYSETEEIKKPQITYVKSRIDNDPIA